MEAAHKTRLADDVHQRERKAQELRCDVRDLLRCGYCENWFNVGIAGVASDGKKFCSEECGKLWTKRQTPIPTVEAFIDTRFRPWAKSTFEKTRLKSWLWYRTEMAAILEYRAIASTMLDSVTTETISAFAAHRSSKGMKPSTVNSALRVLRRMMRLAVEWGVLTSVPVIKKVPGEGHRDRVVTPREEAVYLAAAPEPLASVAAVLLDTGLRPEELYRMEWDDLAWINGRHGSLRIRHGKTKAARRVLPLTPRVRKTLESRWLQAGKPEAGFVWPAPTASGHFEGSSLRKQHAKTFKILADEAKKNNEKPIRPFVIYSLRHTFLTRLGEAGCDVWTLARIAGHSSIAISYRYVHPSDDAVFAAVSRLGGHKKGHSTEAEISDGDAKLLTSAVQ